MYMENKIQKNVLGENLELCSKNPLTGWYRDGCCNTDENDHGLHTVCAKVTTEFLEWCKESGNDLITPHPEFGFPGFYYANKNKKVFLKNLIIWLGIIGIVIIFANFLR